MCEALKEIMKPEFEAERAEGRAEGKTEGRISMIIELVNDGIVSLKEASIRLNMSEETICGLL